MMKTYKQMIADGTATDEIMADLGANGMRTLKTSKNYTSSLGLIPWTTKIGQQGHMSTRT